MKRAIWLTLLLFGAAGRAGNDVTASTDTEADAQPWTPLCIDAVVVARVTDFRDRPLPDYGHDVILMQWPWDLDLDVKRTYLGDIRRGRLTIVASLHVGFPTEFPALLLLSRYGKSWYLVERAYALLDSGGNYVLPMYEQAQDWQLSPKGWMPTDYQGWLRPIRYTTRHKYPGLSAYGNDEEDGENEWVAVRHGRITMKRGFRVADIPAMLAERRALECHRLE